MSVFIGDISSWNVSICCAIVYCYNRYVQILYTAYRMAYAHVCVCMRVCSQWDVYNCKGLWINVQTRNGQTYTCAHHGVKKQLYKWLARNFAQETWTVIGCVSAPRTRMVCIVNCLRDWVHADWLSYVDTYATYSRSIYDRGLMSRIKGNKNTDEGGCCIYMLIGLYTAAG